MKSGIGLPRAALVAGVFSALTTTAMAQTPSVALPHGLNLGSTSFYDGFSGEPGWSYLSWLQYTSSDKIKDNQGNDVPVFKQPKINAQSWAHQFAYASPTTISGWRPGFTVIVPVVSLQSSFGPGPSLTDNGTGIGDILVGASLQAAPVLGPTGTPLFVQRFSIDAILPTGKYDRQKDLNQGAGFASLNPYWAGSLFPAPGWEASWRLHYLYNFKNNKPASSNVSLFNGTPVTNTQAGQAAWVNFTTSYAFTPTLSIGINGYYLQQLSDSRANGVDIPNARERVLGLGPGLMWRLAPGKAFWLNSYMESKVRNRAANNTVLQARFAISF